MGHFLNDVQPLTSLQSPWWNYSTLNEKFSNFESTTAIFRIRTRHDDARAVGGLSLLKKGTIFW